MCCVSGGVRFWPDDTGDVDHGDGGTDVLLGQLSEHQDIIITQK